MTGLADFRPETRVAIEAVAQGMEIVRRGDGAGEITAKGPRDLVTATDVVVEDLIRSTLERDLGATVIGEERGGETPADGSAYWLVDPICGTRNFASGLPLYCVNLALVEGGEVTVGVVGDMSRDELDVAERGGGAWTLVNDGDRRPITTSDQSGIILVEDSHSKGPRREWAARFAGDVLRIERWEIRSFSTTLSLPYVAAGRAAAYVLFLAYGLHAAPGVLLAAEAGATISDLEGHRWTLRSDSIIAACDGRVHEELVSLAAGDRPE
jgi:myo-inositol-1(or 4)-monophosphatase